MLLHYLSIVFSSSSSFFCIPLVSYSYFFLHPFASSDASSSWAAADRRCEPPLRAVLGLRREPAAQVAAGRRSQHQQDAEGQLQKSMKFVGSNLFFLAGTPGLTPPTFFCTIPNRTSRQIWRRCRVQSYFSTIAVFPCGSEVSAAGHVERYLFERPPRLVRRIRVELDLPGLCPHRPAFETVVARSGL